MQHCLLRVVIMWQSWCIWRIETKKKITVNFTSMNYFNTFVGTISVIFNVLFLCMAMLRRQAAATSRPRSMSTFARVGRRGLHFLMISSILVFFLNFAFQWRSSFFLAICNRTRKPCGGCKWKCIWFVHKVAPLSLAPNREFPRLCCCKQPVHVFCISLRGSPQSLSLLEVLTEVA